MHAVSARTRPRFAGDARLPAGIGPAATLLLALALGGCGSRPAVRVEGAWVRAADSAATTAAYFRVVNDGRQPVILTGVSSDLADETMMHTTTREEGRASMHEAERLEVPAGGRLDFEPGSHHVMLVGLRHSLHAGHRARLVLHAAGGDSLPVDALARP